MRSRRLGNRSKSAVRPDHACLIRDALPPGIDELAHAQAVVQAFEAARSRGKERAQVGDHWVEVPTYRHAQRLLDRFHRLASLS